MKSKREHGRVPTGPGQIFQYRYAVLGVAHRGSGGTHSDMAGFHTSDMAHDYAHTLIHRHGHILVWIRDNHTGVISQVRPF